MYQHDAVQQRALSSEAETVIVRGAPGTGKTCLLFRRFHHLVSEKKIPASAIIFITFSSASAARCRRALQDDLGEPYAGFQIHTFHSIAMKIVSSCGWRGRLRTPLHFISPFKEYLVAREVLLSNRSSLAPIFKEVAEKDGFAWELSDFFKLLKQNLLFPAAFSTLTNRLSPELSDLARLYEAFEQYMREKNYAGFSDVIALATEILRNAPPSAQLDVDDFTHILIDEFEEIDPAQFELLRLLLKADTALFVAGDEMQRIYSFRGSGTGRFDLIKKLRPCFEEFHLDHNYRLPSAIAAAARLAGRNTEQREEPCGERTFQVVGHKDTVEQAYEIARDIKRTMLARVKNNALSYNDYNDFAVLCRSASRSTVPLKEAFSYYEIPAVVSNSTGFYMSPMVKSLSDLIKILVFPDDTAACMRVLNIPTLHIDPVELRRLVNILSEQSGGAALHESLRRYLADPERCHYRNREVLERVRNALDYIEGLREKIHSGESLVEVARLAARDLFIPAILEKSLDAGVQDARNLRLLDQLLQDIEEVGRHNNPEDSPARFLESLDHAFARFSNRQENVPPDDAAAGVRIMTIHQAKGLQFPYVYIVDATDEYFPAARRDNTLLDGKSLRLLREALRKRFDSTSFLSPHFPFQMSPKEHLDEERQVLYVALTRATEKLSVNYTEESHYSEPAEPSPFLHEMMPDEGVSDQKKSPVDSPVLSHLANAFSREEIESILHFHIQRSPEAAENEHVRSRLEACGLDGRYICDRQPFQVEPAEPPVLADHFFSASQLSSYLSCPRRYFYERALRIEPGRGKEFDVGRLIHIVLEKFHTKVKEYGSNSETLEAELLEIFNKVWLEKEAGEEAGGFHERFNTILQRETARRKAKQILSRYIKTEATQAPETQILACELDFTFQVRGVPFRARIDRIDALQNQGGHRIIDYKTSQTGPITPNAIKKKFLNIDRASDYAPQDFQMPLYLLAARAEGFEPVELVYFWVAQANAAGFFKKSCLRVGDGKDSLSPEEIQMAEGAVIEVVNHILAGRFPAEPRSTIECQWCSFASICDS